MPEMLTFQKFLTIKLRAKIRGLPVRESEIEKRELVLDNVTFTLAVKDYYGDLLRFPSINDTAVSEYTTWSSDKISSSITGSGGHTHETSDLSPSETPNGIITNFSTSNEFVPGSLMVFVGGLLMKPTTDYTEDGDHLGYTFLSAPPSGAEIQHRYIRA